MNKEKEKVIVEVPHRISGFFEIVDEANGVKIKEYEKIGSRGAGFCLSAVGKTEISIEYKEKQENFESRIYINGEELNQKAETTNFIVNYVRKFINEPMKIEIKHNFDLPVGCGYGASGSGALGTIFGLNHALNLNLAYEERGRIAHIAEVINKTGLGTVCGILGRGLSMLLEPGYPCVYKRINAQSDIKIICGTFGMIPTKSVLSDPLLSAKIKESGRKAVKKLIQNPNMKTFIRASIEYVNETNILNILKLEKEKELMNNLNKLDILGASMNQLGRSVYAIGTMEQEKKIVEIFESYKPEIKIFNLSINNKYPKVYHVDKKI